MTNMPWFKEWQDKRMGDVGYQDLDWEDLGLYHYLKNIAAQTRNAGSLTIYGKPHAGSAEVIALSKKRSMRTMRSPRAATERAERMLRHLLDAGLLVIKDDGAVFIAQWEDEQRNQSDHPDAVRKRDQRDRERAALMQEHQDGCPPAGDGGSGGRMPSATDRGGSAASPPPHASVPVGSPPVEDFGSGGEDTKREKSPGHVRDMSDKIETEDRDRRKDSYGISGSGAGRSPSASLPGGYAWGGGEAAEPVGDTEFDREDPYAWPDQIAACCHFTKDYTPGMKALAAVALSQLGRLGFCDSLKEFKADQHLIRDKSQSANRCFIVGMWKRRGVTYKGSRKAA